MPQIYDIDLISLEYVIPPDKAYGTSRGLNVKRSSSIFVVVTDDGIAGYGEASGPVQAVRSYLPTLKPFFVGRSIFNAGLIAAYVRDKLYHFGEGHFAGCLSALDVALHDAMGKTLGLAVHDLIGGRSLERIPCYATTGYVTPDGMAGLERQLATIDTRVFAGVKIKIGLGPRSDLERVRLAREILGDEILLMVDVNGNYTPEIALQSIKTIEPFGIHWYEEPLPAHDIIGHAELRSRSPIPIATGEGLHGVHEFKQLVDARGVDILQPSLAKCGGLTGARAIAVLADAAHVRMTPAVWGGAFLIATALHFLTSRPAAPHTDNIPFPSMLEFDVADNPLRDRLTQDAFCPEPGGVSVPKGPGLGLVLDPEHIKTFQASL